MKNRLTILLVVLSIFSSSYSQINLSLDKNCLEKNSAILAQALIESIGIDKVSNLLDSNVRILTYWDVDSLGTVLKLKKITSNCEFPNNLEEKLIVYLINNNVHFFICFEKPQGLNECDAYKLISHDLFDVDKKSVLINVSFPGDLISAFSYEQEKAKENGITFSQIEYLQKMISKYSIQ